MLVIRREVVENIFNKKGAVASELCCKPKKKKNVRIVRPFLDMVLFEMHTTRDTVIITLVAVLCTESPEPVDF